MPRDFLTVADVLGMHAVLMQRYGGAREVRDPGALEAALSDPSAWNSITTPLGEEALSAKIRAIAEYTSQISSFWASEKEMLAALRDHAQRSGGERLWVKAGIGR